MIEAFLQSCYNIQIIELKILLLIWKKYTLVHNVFLTEFNFQRVF